jgi:hypothetical protein
MQDNLGVLMKRSAMTQLASLLLLASPVAFLTAACAHKAEPVPVVAISSINDCALIAAIGREHYKFAPTDAVRRIKLNGEDLRWTPGCDWKALGFNLVDLPATGAASGPAMPQIEFHRPHYDSNGAEVRVVLEASPGAETKELCRVTPAGEAWQVAKCEPDPKAFGPKAAAPKPSDATPEKLPKAAPGRRPDTPITDSQAPG